MSQPPGEGSSFRFCGREWEADFHDPAKIFWLLLELKQRLEDLQSVLKEGKKPPLPSPPRVLWEVGDGRGRVQRGKHILCDSPLNLLCLCRAVKWSDALTSKLQARGKWERLERDVRSGHRIPGGTESTSVRDEGGGELLYTSLLMNFLPPPSNQRWLVFG